MNTQYKFVDNDDFKTGDLVAFPNFVIIKGRGKRDYTKISGEPFICKEDKSIPSPSGGMTMHTHLRNRGVRKVIQQII